MVITELDYYINHIQHLMDMADQSSVDQANQHDGSKNNQKSASTNQDRRHGHDPAQSDTHNEQRQSASSTLAQIKNNRTTEGVNSLNQGSGPQTLHTSAAGQPMHVESQSLELSKKIESMKAMEDVLGTQTNKQADPNLKEGKGAQGPGTTESKQELHRDDEADQPQKSTDPQQLLESQTPEQQQQPQQQQFGKNMYVITAPWEVAKLSQAIMDVVKQKGTPILGMDCEGLTKNRCMQLIQVFFSNKCFIIDLQAVNPFCYGFKEVMESNMVMKIFHDFCEDASAMICQYNLICDFVFDTQIAHRLITDFLQQYDYRNINIGLNHLLEEYLGQYNTKKDEINDLMQDNPQFWEQRPLTASMVEYAAQDVQYLPEVYEKMRQMDVFNKDIIDNVCESGKIYQCLTKLYHKILSDTRKCIGYGFINRNIADVNTLDVDTYILAFIKNIQKRIVFCSLNLGVSGVIKDDESIKNFRDNKRSIGEIIKVQVTGFEKSGKIVLKYVEQPLNIISQSHPPQVFYDKNFAQQSQSVMDSSKQDLKNNENPLKQARDQTNSTDNDLNTSLRKNSGTYSQGQMQRSADGLSPFKEANGPNQAQGAEATEPSSEVSIEQTDTPDKAKPSEDQQVQALQAQQSPHEAALSAGNEVKEQIDQMKLVKNDINQQIDNTIDSRRQSTSSHQNANAPFNICAQNTSYNFNNSFYQNYVSNSQKQFNFLVKNAQVGVGTGSSHLQARASEMVCISNICSSQQMSFRDQKINRLDQQLMYSYNNNNYNNNGSSTHLAKPSFEFNKMGRVPAESQDKYSSEQNQQELSHRKIDKNEERSKSEISLEYQNAFNQANQMSEQTGNQRKTHFLADYLDSKEPESFLNDLNLTFDSRDNNSQFNSRNVANQGRFQTWTCKQSTPSSNSFSLQQQAQPFYPTLSQFEIQLQGNNQNNNFGYWNQQEQMQNNNLIYGKFDNSNYNSMGGSHRSFKRNFMKKNFGNHYQSNQLDGGHYSNRGHFSKGFQQKRQGGPLHIEDPHRSTPRHQHTQSFPFVAPQPSTPMQKSSSNAYALDQEKSGWWRNEQFKSQNPHIFKRHAPDQPGSLPSSQPPQPQHLADQQPLPQSWNSSSLQQAPSQSPQEVQGTDQNHPQKDESAVKNRYQNANEPYEAQGEQAERREEAGTTDGADSRFGADGIESKMKDRNAFEERSEGREVQGNDLKEKRVGREVWSKSERRRNEMEERFGRDEGKEDEEQQKVSELRQHGKYDDDIASNDRDNLEIGRNQQNTLSHSILSRKIAERPDKNIKQLQIDTSTDDQKNDGGFGSKLSGSGSSTAGPQKLINFDVVQKICQQNQIFNEKKKDEILGEQIQNTNEGQPPTTPIIVLDNPYQDLDKVISKAKSQQKVSQMKKTKSNFSSGSGSKNAPFVQMGPFKGDKIPDADFVNSFTRKIQFQQDTPQVQMPNYIQSSTPNKQPMFQAKNKKRKDRGDHNIIMAAGPMPDSSAQGGALTLGPGVSSHAGSAAPQRVQSWRNFGNLSAHQQKKQGFQRAGAGSTQYMKKDKAAMGDAGFMVGAAPAIQIPTSGPHDFAQTALQQQPMSQMFGGGGGGGGDDHSFSQGPSVPHHLQYPQFYPTQQIDPNGNNNSHQQ